MNRRPIVVLSLLILAVLTGCTEEKAKALRLAATQFNNESQAAIALYESLSIATIQMPKENQEQKVDFLVGKIKGHNGEIDVTLLTAIMNYGQEAQPAISIIQKEFDNLRQSYNLFNSMFDSLEHGHYFASKDVARAQQIAIKLTLQLIQYAERLKNENNYIFTGERALILERLNKAMKAKNDVELNNAVRAMLELQEKESAAKHSVIVQLLKAAEAGRTTTDIIKGYGDITANDILDIINNSLALSADFIREGSNVDRLLGKYKQYSQTVQSDPYWKPILERQLN